MHRMPVLLLVTCTLLAASACQSEHTAPSRCSITDGIPWSGHPAVGVVRGNGHFCSATLVGFETVLTAAHCVTEDSGYSFETEGTTYTVSQVIRHSGFVVDPRTISDHDIALLKLATRPNVEPAITSSSSVTLGLELTLIGYGKTSNTSGFLGEKRMAKNAIDTVQTQRFRFSGSDGDLGIGGTCLGDSGGPAFASPAGQEVVVGVVSSASGTCGVFTWDTRVDAYQGWLLTASGGDLYGVGVPVVDWTVDASTIVPDSGSPDIAVPDVAVPDIAVPDIAVTPDSASPRPDLEAPADGAVGQDLSTPNDRGGPAPADTLAFRDSAASRDLVDSVDATPSKDALVPSTDGAAPPARSSGGCALAVSEGGGVLGWLMLLWVLVWRRGRPSTPR